MASLAGSMCAAGHIRREHLGMHPKNPSQRLSSQPMNPPRRPPQPIRVINDHEPWSDLGINGVCWKTSSERQFSLEQWTCSQRLSPWIGMLSKETSRDWVSLLYRWVVCSFWVIILILDLIAHHVVLLPDRHPEPVKNLCLLKCLQYEVSVQYDGSIFDTFKTDFWTYFCQSYISVTPDLPLFHQNEL